LSAPSWWPYAWGALGGLGVLLVYYGLRRVMDKARPGHDRRVGLWLVNAGVLTLAASMALAIWTA
jgi:hypothetical protein